MTAAAASATYSSKFMPAGACAVWTSDAYVASSAALMHITTHTPVAPSHPQVKQVQKGQPHYHTYLRECVLQSCQMPPQQDGQKFVCLFQVLHEQPFDV